MVTGSQKADKVSSFAVICINTGEQINGWTTEMMLSFPKTAVAPQTGQCKHPRVLPAPLIMAAVYIFGDWPAGPSIRDLIDNHGRGGIPQDGCWYLEIWDRADHLTALSQGCFTWSPDGVICEALSVVKDYAALNLCSLMVDHAERLWQAPVLGGADVNPTNSSSWHSPIVCPE